MFILAIIFSDMIKKLFIFKSEGECLKTSVKLELDSFSLLQLTIPVSLILNRLKCVFNGGNSLCDLGCGVGNWSIVASRKFDKVLGIDINTERIDMARRIAYINKSKVKFVKNDLFKLDVMNEEFDNLLCFNSLTFLKSNHHELLKEYRRITKKGGRCYITVHTIGFALWLYKNAKGNKLQIEDIKNKIKHYIKYKINKVEYPISFFPFYYIDKIVFGTGWRIVHSGSEGKIDNKPMFRKRINGIPLMKEYILEAV